MLIREDAPSAKESIQNSGKLSSEDLEWLHCFNQYTLEVLTVFTLGSVFNSVNESPAVRVATLVDQLECMSRTHARLMFERKKASQRGMEGVEAGMLRFYDNKTIGSLLVEFLLEREFRTISGF